MMLFMASSGKRHKSNTTGSDAKAMGTATPPVAANRPLPDNLLCRRTVIMDSDNEPCPMVDRE
eukprot:11217443-Lingulodinium_polyedra.AAC.1